MSASPLELADVVRRHRDAVLARYGASLTDSQRKALRDVAACRTAALGGHWWQCADCGARRPLYRSCRHRHGPQCQASTRALAGSANGVALTRGLLCSTRLLLAQSCSVKEPRPVPPRSTVAEHAQKQNTFLNNELQPRLEQARQGQRQVYFVDAAHFVLAPFVGILWCLTRLCLRAASGRKRFNVLGALDAVNHRLIQVNNHSYINAASVCLLLRAVAAAATPGLPITLVLDNARYQKCALVSALAQQLGIELLYLPSYSPNLNLIERVWKFVKADCLRAV